MIRTCRESEREEKGERKGRRKKEKRGREETLENAPNEPEFRSQL